MGGHSIEAYASYPRAGFERRREDIQRFFPLHVRHRAGGYKGSDYVMSGRKAIFLFLFFFFFFSPPSAVEARLFGIFDSVSR